MKVILKLSEELCREGIPHYTIPTEDGAQIRFPWCGGDVLHGKWSHGTEDGHVETWSFPWDGDDVTELSVAWVLENIKWLYQYIHRFDKEERL